MKPRRRLKLEKPEEVAKNFCQLGEDPKFLIKAWINDEIGRLLDSLIELFFGMCGVWCLKIYCILLILGFYIIHLLD